MGPPIMFSGASVGVNCQPQHQDHYLLPEAPPGFALADIFPGQLGVATPTLYGPYGQTPSTLRRLLSRWRPMAVLDPLPLDHLFPARGSFLMRLSLLSLLKTSLPLLEGGWGVYSGIVVVALTQRITLQDFFAHQRVSSRQVLIRLSAGLPGILAYQSWERRLRLHDLWPDL